MGDWFENLPTIWKVFVALGIGTAGVGAVILLIFIVAWFIDYFNTRKMADYIMPFSEFHFYYSMEKNNPEMQELDRWHLYSDFVVFCDKDKGKNRYFYDSYYIGFPFIDTIIYELWQAAGKHLISVKDHTKKAQEVSRKLQSIYWESD